MTPVFIYSEIMKTEGTVEMTDDGRILARNLTPDALETMKLALDEAKSYHLQPAAIRIAASFKKPTAASMCPDLIRLCEEETTVFVETDYEPYARAFGFGPDPRIEKIAKLVDLNDDGITCTTIFLVRTDAGSAIQVNDYSVNIPLTTLAAGTFEPECAADFDEFIAEGAVVQTPFEVPSEGTEAFDQLNAECLKGAIQTVIAMRMLTACLLIENNLPEEVLMHIVRSGDISSEVLELVSVVELL